MQFRPVRSAYTIVEILIATTLSLMLMAAVARMFGDLGNSVNNSRSSLETADRLRSAATRLQMDLDGVTVTMMPPRRVEDGEGYFEYIEGGQYTSGGTVAEPWDPLAGPTSSGTTDSSFVMSGGTGALGTVGEMGDILMFTTRNARQPFTGRYVGGNTIQSDTAEVAWFVRGHTLYRRVLLVVPGLTLTPPSYPNNNAPGQFYVNNDISVHPQGATGGAILVPNTLGDLTRRECRFAHDSVATGVFPYPCNWGILGLPTLLECSSTNSSGWLTCGVSPGSLAVTGSGVALDYWSQQPLAHNFYPGAPNTTLSAISGSSSIDSVWGTVATYNSSSGLLPVGGTRIADDVILTNVIGFDVKAWDPQAGAYVDLGATGIVPAGCVLASPAAVVFTGGSNNYKQPGLTPGAYVYDTWSTSYQATGGGNPNNAGLPFNGMDNSGGAIGVVNSPGEADQVAVAPPFSASLRGIQIKIRVFEPDSRSVREVTIVEDFLPK